MSYTNEESRFLMKQVTHEDVEKELKCLRMDCSAGYDNIAVMYIKPVLHFLTSPLTLIINTCIAQNIFPNQWKIAKISPIPKNNNAKLPDDFRPVSVLPIFSKVFERLIAKQFCNFIEQSSVYKDTMSGFRRSHSTNTLLAKIRDDITEAMSKGELTLAVFSDYSKAFDTVSHSTILRKMNKLGFSKSSLLLMTSYLVNRKQFVQINDKRSSLGTSQYGVPQGSVLGPIIFNLYVTDLQDHDIGPVCQYADDTSQYESFKPIDSTNATKLVNDRLFLLHE